MTQFSSANVPQLTYQYRRRTILGISISFPFAVITVVLRFTARKMARSGFWYDDWFALTGLVLLTVFLSLILVDLPSNATLDGVPIPESTVIANEKISYATELFFTTIQCTLKYSILAFYWRIFSSTSIRMPIYFVTFTVTAWYIVTSLIIAFRCVPVAALWTPSLASEAKCVKIRPFFIGTSIPNILTDLFLLVLPIPYVWRLKITLIQKLFVTGFFLLGGFVLIASIIRLHLLLNMDTKTYAINWTVQDFVFLSTIENCMGVVCVCLPSLRPIVRLLPCSSLLSYTTGSYVTSTPQNTSSHSRTLTSYLGRYSANRRDDQQDEFELLDGAGGSCWVEAGMRAEERSDITTEVEGIAVNTKIDITSSDAERSGITAQPSQGGIGQSSARFSAPD